MAARTARIELRAEPAHEKRLRYAATLVRQSLSAFMLEAARVRAEEVIAAERQTSVPASFFDTLWEALDRPPVASRALKSLAAKSRRVRQVW